MRLSSWKTCHILIEYLPKLHTLVLTNNRLVNLAEIDPLSSLPKLQFLSLLDNSITKKPNYRLYVIHKLKSLRVLDFKKVKAKERAESENLFSSKEVEEEAKRESVKTFTPGEVPNIPEVAEEQQAPKVVAPTPEQIIAIKAAIVNSQTLEEVARLEKALNSGQLPADLKILDDTGSNSVKEQDDKMATDSQNEAEPNNLEEQKDNEATPMEQE
uniref:U2A'/phosphoprotein 32 family A C-terminal domain-containing protein n=1 Tax=Salix viminalis TaxID=40686 RepID=A0A6N2K2Y3_SALVM